MHTDLLENEVKLLFKSENNFFNYITASLPCETLIICKNDTQIIYSNNLFNNVQGIKNIDVTNIVLKFEDIIAPNEKNFLKLQIEELENPFNSNFMVFHLQNNTNFTGTYFTYISHVKFNNFNYKNYLLVLLYLQPADLKLPFHSLESRTLYFNNLNTELCGTFEWNIKTKNFICSDTVYLILNKNKNKNLIKNELSQFLNYIYPKDLYYFIKSILIAILNKTHGDFEFRIYLAEKEIKTLHIFINIHYSFNDKPTKIIGIIKDITKFKITENNLNKKITELLKVNEDLEEFTYVASHDLLEPLRKITTFSGRLAEKYRELLPEEGIMYLDRTIAASETMRMLITDLLEFSRISKTEQPFTLVNLNSVLRMVRTELELTIEETGATFIVANLPSLYTVNTQMKQLFSNIITNAIKFRKQGIKPIIQIEIETVTLEEKIKRQISINNNYYKISITDNGIGFEPEYANKIFHIFQRLHGKNEFPGSGIGLAICKKIVEYHNGIIYAENIAGVGAKFVIILPENQELK